MDHRFATPDAHGWLWDGNDDLEATTVGIPTNKRRLFVAAVKRHGDDSLKSKLAKWNQNVERPVPSAPLVGAYLGRQGSFFLRRGRDVKEIFSFTESTMTITQEQIMGRKPSVARVLEENTLPPMLREVLNLLKLRG